MEHSQHNAEHLEIPVDGLASGFERFLDTPSNRRVFFTGKYGIGKTVFLKRFFAEKLEKYEVYHLYPVKYQISSNENIIRLLKYDILVELLEKYPSAFKGEDEKMSMNGAALFWAFCKERFPTNAVLQTAADATIALSALSPDPHAQAVGYLGRTLKPVLDFDKAFQEFKNQVKATGDSEIIAEFMRQVSQDSHASDPTSHLLGKRISQLKAEKRSVLVLDDFDRMDPEHIFRILNVFSAHFDDEANLFEFDHVIIVGDVGNLQSIFHHKYGTQTDFWGYFDKFFSIAPYELKNYEVIAQRVPEIVKGIKHGDEKLKDAIGESGYVKLFLAETLTRAVDAERLNLRQLMKPLRSAFPELEAGTYRQDFFSKQDAVVQLTDISIRFSIAIFGSAENYVSVLEDIRKLLERGLREQHSPYELFAGLMVKQLFLAEGKDVTQETWQTWGLDYQFQFVHPNGSIRIKGGKAVLQKFFFDVLTEYVRRGMFLPEGKPREE